MENTESAHDATSEQAEAQDAQTEDVVIEDFEELGDEDLEKVVSGEFELFDPEAESQDSEQQETAPEQEDTSQKQSNQEINELRQRLETAEKRIRDKDRYLGHRGSEIKRLRDEVERLKGIEQKLEEGVDDLLLENPRAGHERLTELQRVREHQQHLESAAERQERIDNTVQILRNEFGDDGVDMGHMAKVLEQDGYPPELIQQFHQDPIGFADPATLVQLGKRSRERMIMGELIDYAKRLQSENEKLRTSPNEVLDKVQQNLRKPRMVNGRSGGSSQGRSQSLNEKDFSAMSTQELEEYIRSNGHK